VLFLSAMVGVVMLAKKDKTSHLPLGSPQDGGGPLSPAELERRV
jgi:hypothetical protein